MKKALIFFLSLLCFCQVSAQEVEVTNLQCEYQPNPLGVEAAKPQLRWQILASHRNVMQLAYRVLVADNPALLQKNVGNVWDSKKVASGQSIQVVYAGQKLQPVKTYYWKVMVWDNLHNASAWSEPAKWQMGLLNQGDWKGAQWIAYERLPDSLRIVPGIHGGGDKKLGPGKDILPLFRKEFTVKRSLGGWASRLSLC